MIGQVWSYTEKTEEGCIVAQDRQEYLFSKKDCGDAVEEGNMVEFRTEGRQALDIRLLTAPPGTA